MTQGYWVILRTEIFSLFISPATYVSTFYFLALLGVGFRFFIESFTGTNWILPPLSSLALGLLFGAPALIPFLTMRTIAEERAWDFGNTNDGTCKCGFHYRRKMECKLSLLLIDLLRCMPIPFSSASFPRTSKKPRFQST